MEHLRQRLPLFPAYKGVWSAKPAIRGPRCCLCSPVEYCGFGCLCARGFGQRLHFSECRMLRSERQNCLPDGAWMAPMGGRGSCCIVALQIFAKPLALSPWSWIPARWHGPPARVAIFSHRVGSELSSSLRACFARLPASVASSRWIHPRFYFRYRKFYTAQKICLWIPIPVTSFVE
jgi:hypothetical protein